MIYKLIHIFTIEDKSHPGPFLFPQFTKLAKKYLAVLASSKADKKMKIRYFDKSVYRFRFYFKRTHKRSFKIQKFLIRRIFIPETH